MADLTRRQKLAKASLYEIGYEYLRSNFSKFSKANKIRVAISVLQIFEKDDSKTKPQLHTHFTVILDGKQSDSSVNSEAERSIPVTL